MARRLAKICATIDWCNGQARWVHPVFLPLQRELKRLQMKAWPALDQLNALVADQQTCSGQRIYFTPPLPSDQIGHYERTVFERGEVQTRPCNWHDFFNALAWLIWPRTKARLNAAHIDELDRQVGSHRSTKRDRLTQFDEDGIVLACACPRLAEALRHFDWQTLFVSGRPVWGQTLQAFIVGHALYEKMLQPYLGVTGKVLIVPVEADFFSQPLAEQMIAIDSGVAAEVQTGKLMQQPLYPLPVLGIPGWDERNVQAVFYENQNYFRPRRTQ